jgi:hypothetical protein
MPAAPHSAPAIAEPIDQRLPQRGAAATSGRARRYARASMPRHAWFATMAAIHAAMALADTVPQRTRHSSAAPKAIDSVVRCH